MSVALQAKDLGIGYEAGKKKLLVAGSLNAELKKGELVCIMGANGIGKSTFLRTVAGLQKPISGAVIIKEKNIHQLSNKERAMLLSVVLTGRPTSHFMTVRDLVALGRYPHTNWQHVLSKDDKLVVDSAIEAVSLTNEADKLVAELSDGNAQKAMIARSLAQDAELIILDEPTVHLDVRNKLMIIQLLAELSKQYKRSILLASHDVEMMTQLADKLWLFQKDKLITGTPEDLLRNGIVEDILGTGEFILSSGMMLNQQVTIKGNSQMTIWLQKALKRKGYSVVKDCDMVITVSHDTFTLNHHQKEAVCSSIEATLSTLENYLHE